MAADLHIHVFVGITEEDLAKFNSNTLGSKYFNPVSSGTSQQDDRLRALEMVRGTPAIWIGEVSWLKAALFGDSDTFVPSTVHGVNEIIGEDLPEVTEAFIARLRTAWGVGGAPNNDTSYSVEQWSKVEEFLRQHMGQRLFTISW